MSKWTSSALIVLIIALWSMASSVKAADFEVNAQAASFVLAIVLDDFRTARAGGGYIFSYAPDESEATLRIKVARWLSGRDPEVLAMDASARQTLFRFYWAASMMPPRSRCFVRIEHAACRRELAKWLAREAAGDPRFQLDYKTSTEALGLPALSAAGPS